MNGILVIASALAALMYLAYHDIAVIFPIIALVVLVTLGTLFGSF